MLLVVFKTSYAITRSALPKKYLQKRSERVANTHV